MPSESLIHQPKANRIERGGLRALAQGLKKTLIQDVECDGVECDGVECDGLF